MLLSQQQLAEVIPEKEHLALLSDETTKYGEKYEGFHVADEEGRLYVLRLRNIASKSGKDVLGTFQQILRDIEDQATISQSDTAKKILSKITSTMSDRAATQIKFNTLLEEYRQSVLPDVVDNYEHLTEDERRSMGKLCNFFCGLHALVHMADTASSCLIETDKIVFGEKAPIFDASFSKKSEPGTTRLVRTTCKAFAEGGDEKSGCYGSFLEFVRPSLKENGFRSLPLERFRGNRFNILFMNAARTFFLAEDIIKYLESGADNRLLKAVLYDMKVPHYLAGCKALGLISYLITMPLWSSIEDTSIHLLDIGQRYQEIIDFLIMASNRTEEFMKGDLTLSFTSQHSLENDKIYLYLTQPWDYDNKVQVILEVMLPSLARLLQRIFADHLEGGKWTDATEEERQRLTGLPKHNKFSESVFAHLDRIVREKPSITTITSEACIMFAQNKTMDWLAAKTPAEKSRIFFSASKSFKEVKKRYQQRQHDIQLAKRAAVQAKLAHAEELERKRVQKHEDYTLAIMYWGLWQSPKQVDEYIASMTKKGEILKVLKAQLNFRQHVLKQKAEKKEDSLYAFLKGGKPFTAEQLTSNLKTLISESLQDQTGRSTEEDSNVPLLVGKRVKHLCSTDGKEEWWHGKVISQVR